MAQAGHGPQAGGSPIRIDDADLYTPAVEEQLELEQAVRQGVDQDRQPLWARVFYSSWFYLSCASGLGAFLAWMMLEPFFGESDQGIEPGIAGLIGILLFPTVAGMIGLFLGAGEGIMCRNLRRAMICGCVGLGIGFVGGGVMIFVATFIFVGAAIGASALAGPNTPEGEMPTGFALLVLIMGRGAAWAAASIPAGLGQGIAVWNRKVIFNGLVGGVLGGLLGGILFDPLYLLLTPKGEEAWVSRGVGFTLIGLLVGLFVGLVEGWTKTAWLLMRQGPLAGKQFVLYRDTTILGSSPKADVYLFKDDAIEPRHAVIHNRGGRFEIEDLKTPDGTYVNGVPIERQALGPGDQVVLGQTVLEFALKDND